MVMIHQLYLTERMALSLSRVIFFLPLHPMATMEMPPQPLTSMYLGAVMMLMMWSVTEITGSVGVCTKSEVVTKTRLHFVHRTYLESYRTRGGNCGYYYSSWKTCIRHRTAGNYVNEEESYTEQETKEFCCPGYKTCSSVDGCVCQPVCHLECLNGNCSAPDHCECWSGYNKQQGTENICEPVCSQNCVHGYCSHPEICSCDQGYTLNPSQPYTCQPVCSSPCVNANCTSPDVCTCFPGYEKITGDQHKCHPVCSKPCQNAACIKPELCSCFVGYQKDSEVENICNPVCSEGCINGVCTEPGVCSCLEGYKSQNNYTCKPVCSNCSNAHCSAPEVCSCFPGYKKESEEDSMCFPICSPECINGNCTAPDSCECFDGYELSDDPGVCKPYCSEGCNNGVCTAPEECSCLWSFGSEGNKSDCSRMKSENYDCSFVNTLVPLGFDKPCINFSTEFIVGNLRGCNILNELLMELRRKEKDILLMTLECDNISVLSNPFSLEIFCNATINDEEHTTEHQKSMVFTTEEYFSESTETTDQSLAVYDSTTYNDNSMFFSTDWIGPSTSEALETPAIFTDRSKMKPQISVASDKNFGNIREVLISGNPLQLNATVHFLPLIKQRQITVDYFGNTNYTLVQEWCLCQTNKTWNLCVDTQYQFTICPCRTQGLLLLNEENSIAVPIVKALAVVVVCGILLALAIWYNRNRLVHNYYAPPHRSTDIATPDTVSLSSIEPKTKGGESHQGLSSSN